jgi:diacylglycerol kinase (ATP)
MKNKHFIQRFQFAWNGVKATFNSEFSFRLQLLAAIGALLFLSIFKATPIWWAIFALTIGGVLAGELMNTALEHLIDRVHPELHESIKIAKDCAAGAVLVLSFVSVIILVCFITQSGILP